MNEFPENIVFFDGVCHLCNSTVDFIILRDKKRKLYYAPLQGYAAKKLLSKVEYEDLDSIVFYSKGRRFVKSTAILKIMTSLGGLWSLMGVFYIFPRFFRDFVYAGVAKRRYHWFGKSESCRMPLPHERKLFLD